MMDRVPIRIRLTVAFTIVMALVLAATGLFLYLRLASSLDRTIDQGLRARATDVTALAQQSDTGLRESQAARANAGFAQILTPSGRVVDATPGLQHMPLLRSGELAGAERGSMLAPRMLGGAHVRLLAVPVDAQGRRLVVVVGASLEPRAAALSDLRAQLYVGGPLALLVASVAGYLLAAAALRPVEAMSKRAATISGTRPGGRLPVTRAEDEVGRLGRRLNHMLERVETALERERNLVSNASHELRTPLALMKTEIELALAEPESTDALAAALRSAGEETDRLAQLADDLLLLARIDSGRLSLRRSLVSIPELLDAIALRFRTRAVADGREIVVSAPPALTVLADRRRLEQALSNLVENALRHGRGRVTMQGSGRSGKLELSVADEGPGFPSSLGQRAFERFARAERSDGAGGAGLGLAIVAAIAEAHGGEAAASNTDSGGALVAMLLPVPGDEFPSSERSSLGTDGSEQREVSSDDEGSGRNHDVRGRLRRRPRRRPRERAR
jgi:two-component system OmpR family sensor kinase